MLRRLLALPPPHAALLALAGLAALAACGEEPEPEASELLRAAVEDLAAGEVDSGLARARQGLDRFAAAPFEAPPEAFTLEALVRELLPRTPGEAEPELLVDAALALARRTDLATARAPLAAFAEVHPDHYGAPLAIGHLALAFDIPGAAEHWWSKAVAIDPEAKEAARRLAALHALGGRPQRALEVLAPALRAHPDDADLRLDHGQLLAEAGEHDAAAEEWRRVLGSDAGAEVRSRAANRIGGLMVARGDRPAARELFERAVELAPDRAPGHLNLGSLLLEMGRDEEARPHLERAAALAAGDARPRLLLGRIADTAGDEAAAEALFREALALDAGASTARYRLALLLRRQGREAEAREVEAGGAEDGSAPGAGGEEAPR